MSCLQIQAAGPSGPIHPRDRREALLSDLHRPTTAQLDLLPRRRQPDPGRLSQFKAQVQIRGDITVLRYLSEPPVATVRLTIQGHIEALQLQPQHRLPLPQAGQGIEMNTEPLKLDRGAIGAGGSDGRLTKGHTPWPQTLVGADFERVTESGADALFEWPAKRTEQILSGGVQRLNRQNGSDTNGRT